MRVIVLQRQVLTCRFEAPSGKLADRLEQVEARAGSIRLGQHERMLDQLAQHAQHLAPLNALVRADALRCLQRPSPGEDG